MASASGTATGAGSMPRDLSTNHGGEIGELRRSGNELEHSAPVPLSTSRTQDATATPPPPPPTDEGPSPFVQQGVARKNLKAAAVQHLDGTKFNFYVHKKADGEILFDMVAAQLGLIEKDYFGLVFIEPDQQGSVEANAHNWLYKDKKIEKQLKGRPWSFAFVLKFYPPDPDKLAEDTAQDLMYLQLKRDVQAGKLPITLPIEAKLAALAAQADFGDYRGRNEQYEGYLRHANTAHPLNETVIEKIADLHTQHKGLTAQEAKLAYLDECRDIAMYGIWQFPTKERAVHLGVNYHGLHVHNDMMRLHRFAWPSINRFSYRGNAFSIRLNVGELNGKKEKTVTYKMPDYQTATRFFNLAVEHHTFFRLIQPEARDKKGLFKLCTSNRFRYQGRTNIQSHMASQLFDQSQSQYAAGDSRVNAHGSKSTDDIQHHAVSALHHADDGMRTPPENPIGPPLATSTVKKKKKQGDDEDGLDEVGGPVYHSYRLHHRNQHHARHTQQHLSHVTTSSSTAAAAAATATATTSPVTAAAVAASFSAASALSRHAQGGEQQSTSRHGELVEDYLDGGTHPSLLPDPSTSSSTAVDYNTTTAVSDGSVIIRTTTTRRIVTTTASTQHYPSAATHTEALAERQPQHRFTSASLISNTLSSTSSNTSFTSALDDTLVLLNDSGYEPSVSVGGPPGAGGSLRPDAAQSPTSSKYTSRVTSPSYVLNSSFDESRVSPYEGERFSATASLPYSSSTQQKVRFAHATAGPRSRSPLSGLFTARLRGGAFQPQKSPMRIPTTMAALKDPSLRPLSTSSPLGLDMTWRQGEVPFMPIGDRVQLYNSGVYSSLPPDVEDVNQLGETHTFTLLPGLRRRRRKKRIPTAEKILRQSRAFDGTLDYLTPRSEVEHIPLRYCVACYHSGFSHRPWVRHRTVDAGGRGEVTSWLDKRNYTFSGIPCLEHSRLEKDPELETTALRAHATPYYVPYYDRSGPTRPSATRVDGPKQAEKVAVLHLRRGHTPPKSAEYVLRDVERKHHLEQPTPLERERRIKVSVGDRLRAKLEEGTSAPVQPALSKSSDMKGRPVDETATIYRTERRESPAKRDSASPIQGSDVKTRTSPTKERLALLHLKSAEKTTEGASKTHVRDDMEAVFPTVEDKSMRPTVGAPPKPPRSLMCMPKPKAVLHLKRHQTRSGEKPAAVPTATRTEFKSSPAAYSINVQPYSGPQLESMSRSEELPSPPISQHTCVYHSGWSAQRRSLLEKFSTVLISRDRYRERNEFEDVPGPPTPPSTPLEPPSDAGKSTALLHLRAEGSPLQKRAMPETVELSKVGRSPPCFTHESYHREMSDRAGVGKTVLAAHLSESPIAYGKSSAVLHLRSEEVAESPLEGRTAPRAVRVSKVAKSPSSPTHAAYHISVVPYTGELHVLRHRKEIEKEPITNLQGGPKLHDIWSPRHHF